MTPKVVVVFCVHHKPWLIMSTLISLAAQQRHDVDLHFLYQIGGGERIRRDSYVPYYQLAAELGEDPQLSPYDERVQTVTHVGWNRTSTCLENDGALDSGAWYKFVKSGAWKDYDYVLFLGEGSLFTRPGSLPAILEFAGHRSVHCVAGGHEKRRMPKDLFLNHNGRRDVVTRMHLFHDDMTRTVFEIFGRDPDFSNLVSAWSSGFPSATQDHVPDIWSHNAVVRRLRDAANRREPGEGSGVRQALRHMFHAVDRIASRRAIAKGEGADYAAAAADRVYVDQALTSVRQVVSGQIVGRTRFHLEPGPEWYGAATNHLMSREFLEALSRKLDAFDIWEAVDLPFAGTALEVVWGLVPAWLGYEKWFTDGLHRVRKHFVTYRREDDADGMASYINRYFRGVLEVSPYGDFLHIENARSTASFRARLPAEYFA